MPGLELLVRLADLVQVEDLIYEGLYLSALDHAVQFVQPRPLSRREDAVQEAVKRLQQERPQLYMRLVPVYFADDPNPTLPDRWREEASNSRGARLALTEWSKAVDFMHSYLKERLGSDDRLKVYTPEWVERTRLRRPVKPRRAEALATYYRHLERHDRSTAVRLTAQQTGYSVGNVRVIIRQAEST
jgi:hypothetical protein